MCVNHKFLVRTAADRSEVEGGQIVTIHRCPGPGFGREQNSASDPLSGIGV